MRKIVCSIFTPLQHTASETTNLPSMWSSHLIQNLYPLASVLSGTFGIVFFLSRFWPEPLVSPARKKRLGNGLDRCRAGLDLEYDRTLDVYAFKVVLDVVCYVDAIYSIILRSPKECEINSTVFVLYFLLFE